jgi:hypothetical protein
MQTVICARWGTRYGVEYVNRLYRMVMRHTERPTRLLCFTDDPAGLVTGVEGHPLPPINIPERVASTGWRKLSFWQHPLADLEGDVLFLDLDLVITGGIDAFFDFHPGAFCVIRNWTQPHLEIGNTSVYRFPAGRHTHIFETFNRDPESVLTRYAIEQQYISGEIGRQIFWPSEWCVSFKHDLLPRWPMNFFKAPALPATARIVAFTGKPDPDEAAAGRWPTGGKPWKAVYKHVRPAPWIAEHWL